MRKYRHLVLALGLALLAGCAEDGIVAPEDGVVGTYALQSINGQSLPFTEGEEGGFWSEILSIEIDFAKDGTYLIRESHRFGETGGAATTENETSRGTWTLSGKTLSFVEDGDTINGTLDGNTFTVMVEGMTFVFRKK